MNFIISSSGASADAAIGDSTTMFDSLRKGVQLYDQIKNGENRDSSASEEAIKALLRAEMMCRQASLFPSDDETIRDVHTSALPFLRISLMVADIHSEWSDMATRRLHGEAAKRGFESFLRLCARLEVMDETTKTAMARLNLDATHETEEDGSNEFRQSRLPAMTREEKIASFKAKRALEKEVAVLKEMLATSMCEAERRKKAVRSKLSPDGMDSSSSSSSGSSSSSNNNSGDGSGGSSSGLVDSVLLEGLEDEDEDIDTDIEDVKRRLGLLQLHLGCEMSLEQLPLLQQELALLSHREALARAEGELDEDGSDAVASRLRDLRLRGGRDGRGGPGLSVTRVNKVGDQIFSSRETIKADVFRPRMQGPTMSLAEFADGEKAQALERAAAEQAALEAEGPGRRYTQLENDGLEDDAALVDLATQKDREWDDFKEANPRGWGNKMGKRY